MYESANKKQIETIKWEMCVCARECVCLEGVGMVVR